jgi:ATP-dependent DNA helicase RecG
MQRTESEILEFKSSFGEWKEIIQTLCGFANKNGGTVIVGFDDSGQPTNLQIGKSTIEDFVNKIKTNTDPTLFPSVNRKTFALGEIVEISIPKSDFKPVFAFGRAYTRIGKNTIQLSANEIRKLAKKYTLPDFDSQMTNVNFSDFEFDEKLIAKINKKFFGFSESNACREILSEFKLIKNNKINKGAYLCFVKENKLFKNAQVKAARFKGNKPVSFIDMQDFTGNIINAVDDCLNFIKKHINRAVIIEGKPERTERWDYPLPALREAVINAIVHRDYNDKGNVQIRIFDDSLEIWSPGLLPKEIDIESIEITGRSIPGNTVLADIFHTLNYIEAWGTGLSRIIEYSKQFGIGKPEFKHIQGALVIKFFRNVPDDVTDKLTDEHIPYQTKNQELTNEGLMSDLTEGLNEGLKGLFHEIFYNPGLNSSQLSVLVERPQKTIERWLSKLKNKNLIEFRGSKKTGGYFYINYEDVF